MTVGSLSKIRLSNIYVKKYFFMNYVTKKVNQLCIWENHVLVLFRHFYEKKKKKNAE